MSYPFELKVPLRHLVVLGFGFQRLTYGRHQNILSLLAVLNSIENFKLRSVNILSIGSTLSPTQAHYCKYSIPLKSVLFNFQLLSFRLCEESQLEVSDKGFIVNKHELAHEATE